MDTAPRARNLSSDSSFSAMELAVRPRFVSLNREPENMSQYCEEAFGYRGCVSPYLSQELLRLPELDAKAVRSRRLYSNGTLRTRDGLPFSMEQRYKLPPHIAKSNHVFAKHWQHRVASRASPDEVDASAMELAMSRRLGKSVMMKRAPTEGAKRHAFYSTQHDMVDELKHALDSRTLRPEQRMRGDHGDVSGIKELLRSNAATLQAIQLVKAAPRPPLVSLTKTAKPSVQRPVLIRAMWRWAIGRAMALRAKKAQVAAEFARRTLEDLRKIKRRRAEQLLREQRTAAALQLILEMQKKQRHRTKALQKPTPDRLAALKKHFDTVDHARTGMIALDDVGKLLEHHLTIDPSVCKKFSRNGMLDFDDIIHVLYPELAVRDIRALLREHDSSKNKIDPNTEAPAEVKAEIAEIFRICDQNRRGVLSRSDLSVLVPEPELQDILQLDTWFSDESGLITLQEFTQKLKFGFPPFFGDVKALGESIDAFSLEKFNPIPQEVLLLQEKATSSV